jgi:hypothetical protein
VIQGRVQWRTAVSAGKSLWVPLNAGNFLTIRVTSAFQEERTNKKDDQNTNLLARVIICELN